MVIFRDVFCDSAIFNKANTVITEFLVMSGVSQEDVCDCSNILSGGLLCFRPYRDEICALHHILTVPGQQTEPGFTGSRLGSSAPSRFSHG